MHSCLSAVVSGHALGEGMHQPRPSAQPNSRAGCLRFAELESIVVITMILQRHKVTVKEEPEFAGETFEEKKERVMKSKSGLTRTLVISLLGFWDIMLMGLLASIDRLGCPWCLLAGTNMFEEC